MKRLVSEAVFKRRLRKLSRLLEEKGYDAYVVNTPSSLYYFTGFRGLGSLLVCPGESPLLIVPVLDSNKAFDEARGVEIATVPVGEKTIKRVVELLKERKCRRIGFERLSLSQSIFLRRRLRKRFIKEFDDIVWKLRKKKDEGEISLMKEAARLAIIGLQAAVGEARPGMTELELAAEIEYAMRSAGSERHAFDIIVVSGKRTSYPHACPSDKQLSVGEPVTVDLGAYYGGYCSDFTRTFWLEECPEEQEKAYRAVLSAYDSAFKKAREGVPANEIDRAAREKLGKLSRYFVHSLGHGVGIDVHEPPRISPTSKEVLDEGNIITIEPGIYVRGKYGIRVEDTVLILKDKAERLAEFTRELLVI